MIEKQEIEKRAPAESGLILEKPDVKTVIPPLLFYKFSEEFIADYLLEDLAAQGITASMGQNTQESYQNNPCFHFYRVPERVDAATVYQRAKLMWDFTQGNCVWIFLTDEPTREMDFYMKRDTGFNGKHIQLVWRYLPYFRRLENPALCAQELRAALTFYQKKNS